MSNLFARLKALVPQPSVIVGVVVSVNADGTSTIQLPSVLGTLDSYGTNVAAGPLIRARGTSVPAGKRAFVRAGVVESQGPDGEIIDIPIGRVVIATAPTPAPAPAPTPAPAPSSNVTMALTGVAGSGAVGTVSTATPGNRALTGVAAAGQAGSVKGSRTVALSGNGATGSAGSVGTAQGTSVGLTGNAASAAVGTAGVSRARALSGAAVTGAVGTVSAGMPAGLLDSYASGMTLCVSRRRRLTAYTGPAVRVRRASDNVEQDIDFASDYTLDSAALATFLGSGSGYVAKWYDQSGNGNDLVQATASKQPAIYLSGTYQGQAVFDGSNDALQSTNSCGAVGAVSIFLTGTRSSSGDGTAHMLVENGSPATNSATLYYSEFNSRTYLYTGDGSNYSQTQNSVDLGSGSPKTLVGISDRAQSVAADKSKVYIDGSAATVAQTDTSGTVSTSSTLTAGVWNVGARNASSQFTILRMRSLVIFEANKATDQAAISTALNVT